MKSSNRLTVQSWNVNGIRSAHKKNFSEWLAGCESDVVMLQEVRASEKDIPAELMEPCGHHSYWHEAQKKGYSGVGILTKLPKTELNVIYGLGDHEFDSEGRVITLVWTPSVTLSSTFKKLAFVSAYFPNSQTAGQRLGYKLNFCEKFRAHLNELEKQGCAVVAGGDFNIAHTEIDLTNPKQNEKNAGYLPEERQWLSKFLDSGYTDTFRMFEQKGGFYTWWSNRSGAREKNIGWRIDYHVVSANLLPKVESAKIHANVLGSDHCPVSVKLNFSKE
jgi:exodeoxyribonuclease III